MNMNKTILNNLISFSKNQLSFMSKKRVNYKKSRIKTELPIFQYPTSKEGKQRVYVWGLADTGALGVPNDHTKSDRFLVKTPKRLSFAEKYQVTDVTCGFGFTVYTIKSSDEIKLYGTGINTDSQIGYHELKYNQPLEMLMYPAPIRLPSPADANTKILKLSAGRAHLLVLTSVGLFSLGSNVYGQCGRGIIEDEKYLGSSTIHYIPNIEGEKIIDIQCGQDHSLLVTEKGDVFSCGWGADGQTGLGHNKNVSHFTRVKGDTEGEKITKLSCSGDCVLALNDKNEMFGWGNSEYGQLKVSNGAQQINISKILPFCKDLGKIIDIAAGGSFCLALNDYGQVYVWGYGLLGKGLEYNYPNPWLIPPTLFGTNDLQPDNKVTSIYCGIGHLAAITNFGDLYTWGRNRDGCLGIGSVNNQCIPLKVSIGASVLKVTCGLDHTVAICKPFI